MPCYWTERTGGGFRPCYVQPNGLEVRNLPIETDMAAALKSARAALATVLA
jgi:hypothetical protein